MARVFIREAREQEAHFGLYRTSAGGDDSIFVRRKVGEPTDYQHNSSRKLKTQRDYFALASRLYAGLTPCQKAQTRHEFEEVEFIDSHGKSDTKILMGRQLFIARQIHSLNTTGKPILSPYSICTLLVDEDLNPLEGNLSLSYKDGADWKSCGKDELVVGNYLFCSVPRAKELYRVYGESEGYTHPDDPDGKELAETELFDYHYHILEVPHIKCCYAEPRGYAAHWRTAGTRRSQLFKPMANFTLRAFVVFLLAYPYPFEPPPSEGFVAIHELTGDTTPSEPPLAQASFPIHLPEWPNVMACVAPFTGLELQVGKWYNWVVGFPGPLRPQGYIGVVRDKTGVCNPGVDYGNGTSYWLGEQWTPWERWNIPFCAYRAMGY